MFAVLAPGGQFGNFWIHPRIFMRRKQNQAIVFWLVTPCSGAEGRWEKMILRNFGTLPHHYTASQSTGARLELLVFWATSLCSDVDGYQRFGGPCFLHLQGWTKNN
jgi:hypothetical protein